MWWHTRRNQISSFGETGRVHLNRRWRQFSRLLAAEVCASAEVMLDTPCSEVVWRVLATHSIRQFPLHFPSRASPCAITFQLHSTPADAHTSAASSRLNWRPHRFKWTRPFRRKTKSGFCACAITFQTQSTTQTVQNSGVPAARCKILHMQHVTILTQFTSSYFIIYEIKQ